MTTKSWNVPAQRITFSPAERQFVQEGLKEIFACGQLTMGRFTAALEQAACELFGARFCLAVSSGTAALELILRALGLRGASVLVPANTFLATALAVVHSGNRVIFADSDPRTMCLDLEDARRRIEEDTKAVIVVHIGGLIMPQIHELRSLCRGRGLYLIEDCAHAHGCSFDGESAGTFGIAGAFSFFATKVLTSGEGGMVITDDRRVYENAKSLRNHGKSLDGSGKIERLGANYRLSELGALLGLAQVRRAREIFAARRAVAARYDAGLAETPGVVPLSFPPALYSTYYKYVLTLEQGISQGSVRRNLEGRYGVQLAGEVYARPCPLEPVWRRYTLCGASKDEGKCAHGPSCFNSEALSFPGAVQIAKGHICLPIYPDMTEVESDHVITSLRAVVGGVHG